MASKLEIKVLGLLGALAPIIYLATTVLGGYLWTGYSHYSETVSTLTSSGAPNANILNPLYATYNVFIILLALGLYLGIKTRGALLGLIFMTISGIGGLVLY